MNLSLGAALRWLTTIVGGLLTLLSLIAVWFTATLLRTAHKRGELAPKPEAIGLGAVTNFFDTLGIGSFAPTTAYMKLRKMAPDSYFPAILNAGHALPTVTQALVFISLVRVDPWLMLACIVAAVAGAFIGAPIVQRSPVRLVQGVVGAALLIAAILFALKNLNLLPPGGDALTLPPTLFAIAVGAHFVMGVLMMFGIGLYAPSLIALSLLGLNPAAAFPIMMGSCAFLMPISSLRFVRSSRIDLRIVLGLAFGGIPAVLLAAFVVKSLDLVTLRWLVVVVVVYAALLLLRSGLVGENEAQRTRADNRAALPEKSERIAERSPQAEGPIDVFVSYKRDDERTVGLLVQGLRQAGLRVWWDKDIPPSAPWETTIEESLRRAHCALVCWSSQSTASENVKSEAREAKRRERLVQIYIDECDPPLFFGERQGVSLVGWDGSIGAQKFTEIYGAIARLLPTGSQR